MEQLHPMFQTMVQKTDGWTGASFNRSSLDYNFMTRHPTMSTIFLCVTGLTAICGTTGNILIIGAVFSYKRLNNNSGNMIILNLAVADLFITAIVGPFHMLSVAKGPRIYMGRELFCQILGSFCLVSCIVSMLLIAAVAVNRCVCICNYFTYRVVFTRKKTLAYCCGLWVVGLLLDLPTWLGWTQHSFNLKEMNCSIDREKSRSYAVFLTVVILGLPILTVFACYVTIYRYVNKTHTTLRRFSSRDKKGTSTSERAGNRNILPAKREDVQLAVTLFLTFITFLIMWSPYMTAVAVDFENTWPKQLYVVAISMGHSNSLLNSIIYGVSNPVFRQGYAVFLHKIFCCSIHPAAIKYAKKSKSITSLLVSKP